MSQTVDPMDLSEFTDAQLSYELERRAKEAEETARLKRETDAQWALTNIDALLELVPEHSGTGCTDRKSSAYYEPSRCNRCFLLQAKRNHHFDSDYAVKINIERVYSDGLKEDKWGDWR